MTFKHTESQAQNLIGKADEYIQENGCDHSLRFAFDWASQNQIGSDDFLDLLEEQGCFCDCEVVLNLPGDGDIFLQTEEQKIDQENLWKLPSEYKVSDPSQKINRYLVSTDEDLHNCYAPGEDILVPPPFGTKARKRVRKSMHFFIGLKSGFPNEVGFVKMIEPIDSYQFAKIVRDSGYVEMASFRREEAHFLLSKLKKLPEDTPVATHFMEVNSVNGSKRTELRIHKIFMKK